MTPPDGTGNRAESAFKGQIISIIVLVVMLITFWNMLDLVLLTFIITFILYNLVVRLQRRFKKISAHGLPAVLVLALIYIAFVVLVVMVSVNLIPKIAEQFAELSSYILKFDFTKFEDMLDPRIAPFVVNIDIAKYVTAMGLMISSTAAKVGQFSLNLLFALVLSFLLTAEKDKIKEFGGRLENSRISFIYKYFIDFGGVFAKTFGNVMKVQITIAFLNALISTIILSFMRFPSVIGIGLMIFCLGLIPVAGVVLSLIPLCIIAFTIGGLVKVVEVIIMIVVIHTIEAYILNPKLMANKVRLPVCFVFIILLVSEHYLGVWGLLIGVPIFIFLMAVLEVDYAIDKKEKKEGTDDGTV